MGLFRSLQLSKVRLIASLTVAIRPLLRSLCVKRCRAYRYSWRSDTRHKMNGSAAMTRVNRYTVLQVHIDQYLVQIEPDPILPCQSPLRASCRNEITVLPSSSAEL